MEEQVVSILIVGARGMLGSDLMETVNHTWQVLGVDIEECDITDQKETLNTLLRMKPSWVINAAAYTQVDQCETNSEQAFKVNAEAVSNLALACKEINTKLLHVSTDYVFDGKTKNPYREEDPVNPLSVYGNSKCQGEAAVQDLLDDFIIVRTGGLYGKRGVNFVNTIVKMAQERDELRVVNDQWMSPTCTIDLSMAIGTLVQLSARGIFHIVNSGFCTWYEFACKIVAITDSPCRVVPISSDELDRPAPRPAFAVLNCSKYSEVTGMKLKPWEDALNDYLSTL
jgi:dTDP-4-dehydrorhamnose reductase